MSTQTMSYEKEAGTGKTTTASLLIQERKADGSVLRREEYLLFGKAVPREELHRGMEQLTYYTRTKDIQPYSQPARRSGPSVPPEGFPNPSFLKTRRFPDRTKLQTATLAG
ncbi:MAG: hypothetical protein MJ202_09725 [Lentisphaeria bacterium]|nr:hypothetical protein [Lentisphaeria bacterium]